jgi:putative NIF3 family GTP cyclohydrolase 1 type 2
VAAGHYHTEKVFGEFLASYLRKRVPDTAFLLSQAEAAPMGAL